MKNQVLRILISAIILTLTASLIVWITGLFLKWETVVQFSDGFFWTGAIFLLTGLINHLGTVYGRTTSGLQYSQSAVHLDANDRLRIWDKDLLRGYNFLAIMGISGLLMIGIAILVGNLGF